MFGNGGGRNVKELFVYGSFFCGSAQGSLLWQCYVGLAAFLAGQAALHA
jgi:hypothetical protein